MAALVLAACKGAEPPATKPTEPVETAAPAPVKAEPAPVKTEPVKPEAEPVLVGIDGVSCVGGFDAVPAGAVREEDPEVTKKLLAVAVSATDKGNLCQGTVYRATEPIAVYRVWNSEKEYTQLGRWWTLGPPTGTRAQYQKDYVICDGWSRLDRVVACKLKVGSHFVIGPGQSVRCDTGPSYAKSAMNQVYIANDGQAGVILVDQCEPARPWP